ncbi:dTDP-4-dehydrorhamnose reductase [Rhizobium sp. AG855]|uniref:dTDP-4-dehydrorhamnose reductase n=1 Tax=Rhizobium sp. AG855 TaxID=2183898 RepID=UPI000E70D47B|nr:dTDP-4-dehydrorhamnose reductase [Rhizobium sp. AG855]
MRIAVTGKSGQLVTALRERANDVVILPIGRPEFDLRGARESTGDVLKALRPDAVISAAAYTAVDKAETEQTEAGIINGEAPGFLAAACNDLGIPIAHISTDYVFDGRKLAPYLETDPACPLGVYGSTKLAGEQAVARATENYAILRTAWVYSPFGGNFLKTMLRLAQDRPELRVVQDQIGNPTSALDIADAVLGVVKNLVSSPTDARLRGLFHMTANGEASWAEFAGEIMRASAAMGGPHAAVVPISTSEYPTLAHRPANSRLDSTKLKTVHDFALPQWQGSTRSVVARLLGNTG